MSAHDNGGPAFPRFAAQPTPGGGVHYDVSGGMTLRDYFAAKALAAMLANPNKEGANCDPGGLATFPAYAYEWADAMLKARTV